MSVVHNLPIPKISQKSTHNFLGYSTFKETSKHTSKYCTQFRANLWPRHWQ